MSTSSIQPNESTSVSSLPKESIGQIPRRYLWDTFWWSKLIGVSFPGLVNHTTSTCIVYNRPCKIDSQHQIRCYSGVRDPKKKSERKVHFIWYKCEISIPRSFQRWLYHILRQLEISQPMKSSFTSAVGRHRFLRLKLVMAALEECRMGTNNLLLT